MADGPKAHSPRNIDVVTQREVIRSAASAWREQYYRDKAWSTTMSGSSEVVYRKLMKLDLDTATSDDVTAIIGNDSWSTIDCDGCERDVTAVVRVWRWEDENGASLCADCLASATALLAKEPA